LNKVIADMQYIYFHSMFWVIGYSSNVVEANGQNVDHSLPYSIEHIAVTPTSLPQISLEYSE
jgi:hypothetical protein